MIVDLAMWIFQTLQKRKKQDNMSTTQETQEAQVYYVWGKTERAGDIVQEDTTVNDPKWMNFTDGTKCNRELIDEMLLRTSSEEEAQNLSISFNPNKAIVSGTSTSTPKQERKVAETKSTPEPEVNVMMEMLKKMSAKNKAKMPVQVNIPSKQVYDLLKDQMDITKKDLNEQIGLLVESQIDSLRDQLKEQIESFIKDYYNGTTATTIDS